MLICLWQFSRLPEKDLQHVAESDNAFQSVQANHDVLLHCCQCCSSKHFFSLLEASLKRLGQCLSYSRVAVAVLLHSMFRLESNRGTLIHFCSMACQAVPPHDVSAGQRTLLCFFTPRCTCITKTFGPPLQYIGLTTSLHCEAELVKFTLLFSFSLHAVYMQAVLPVLPRHEECVSVPSSLLCTSGSLPPA